MGPMGGRRLSGAPAEFSALTGTEALSIDLGPRNGHNDAANSVTVPNRYVQGPALTNLFGTGNNSNVGARTASALGIRVRFQPGSRTQLSTDTTATREMPIFGTGTPGDNRATVLQYYPAQHSKTGFAGRFVWHVQGGGTGPYLGSSDPLTGSPGSAAADRGLRSAVPSVNNQGILHCVIALRGGASGAFDAFTVQDGVLTVGDSQDPATYSQTFIGNATPTNAVRFGAKVGGSSDDRGYFNGSFCDFVQLEGTAGTDAEWVRFEQGEDPATIWGSNCVAYFRFRNTADLALTSGSRGYAACTLAGTTSYIRTGPQLRPSRVSTNGILPRPYWQGFIHPVNSTKLKAITDAAKGARAAMFAALTGDVSRDVYVIGAATHLQARAVRISDNQVVKPWTRVTASASTGWVPTTLADVIAGEHRYEYRREDDNTCVAVVNDVEGVGPSGPASGQSQLAIGLRNPSNIALTPSDTSLLRYYSARGDAVTALPVDGGIVRTKGLVSDGVVAMGQLWDEYMASLGLRIPCELGFFCTSSTGTWHVMYHRTASGIDMAGDGTTPLSGMHTIMGLAKSWRFSFDLVNWCTDDEGFANGGTVASFATIYGSKAPTERAWTERGNEYWGGIPKVGAGAPEIAERTNRVKLGAVYRPFLVGLPRSRARDGINATASANDAAGNFRKTQHDYYELGTGRDAAVDATLAAFNIDTVFISPDTEHQALTDPMGNINFCCKMMQGLAQAVGATTTADPRSKIASAAGAGTADIDVTFTLANGGTIDTLVTGTAVTDQVEVRENGGSWVKLSTVGTASFVSGKLRLHRTSGNWHAITDIRYGWAWPFAVGSASIAAENLLLKGVLVEVVSGHLPAAVLALTSAAMGGATMRSYIPIQPSLAPVAVS